MEKTKVNPTQSAGAEEYTDCIPTERWDPLLSNECPDYDIKPSDGGA